ERYLAGENPLRRALVNERLLDFAFSVLCHRRARHGWMTHRMPSRVLEKIRGDLEHITFRVLDHLEFSSSDHAQQRILDEIFRVRAITHAAQEIAEKRCR